MARRRRNPEIISGTTGGATPSSGQGWSATRTSAGVYVITFEASFRLVNCVAAVSGINQAATVYQVTVSPTGPNQVTFYVALSGTGATDVNITFVAIGAQQ